MKYVAFIGSRDLNQFNDGQIELFMDAVKACVQHDYTIVTGAAKGADQLAAEVALQMGGQVLLVLPWERYEHEWLDKMVGDRPHLIEIEVYDSEAQAHQAWKQSVRDHHPMGKRMKPGAFNLHARNYGIIERAGWVVALPSYRNSGGGTAQGLRVAAALGKRVWDLREQKDCIDLMKRLMGKPPSAAASTTGVDETSNA